MLPLEGITVVSMEQAVAAPFATRQLADLGARVIKIERPGSGDFARNYDKTVKGKSSHFVWLNRSKESVTLDMKKEEAKEIVHSLLKNADVFIQNLAPGAAERLGFGAETLHEAYPQLIICGISGYGANGSYSLKKAYDLLIQCETGVVSITGTEETPSKTGIPIADIAAGMYAYTGILNSIIQRYKTGQGQVLEVSMFEAVAEWMGYPLYYTEYGGEEPKRTGASHATIAPYGPVVAGDGKRVFFSIQNNREWDSFCDTVLELPELKTDERFCNNTVRVANRKELDKILEGVFRKFTAEEAIERLETAKIANARLNTVREFIEHPQLKERNRWREVGSEVGPLKALVPPVTFQNIEYVMNEIPKVGQHTASVLSEIGYSDMDIERLKLNEVI